MFILKCKCCGSKNIKKVFCMKETTISEYWYSSESNYEADIKKRFKDAYCYETAQNANFIDFGFDHQHCQDCDHESI